MNTCLFPVVFIGNNDITSEADLPSKFKNGCETLLKLGFTLNPRDLDGTRRVKKNDKLRIKCGIESFPPDTYITRNDEDGFMVFMRIDSKNIHTPLIRFKFKGYQLQICQVYCQE
jgi:hypothetical protein